MPENNTNTFGQIRKALIFHKKVSEHGRLSDSFRFRLDRFDAARYFAIHPKWEEIIRSYFKKLRNMDEEIVHVDICGRAIAKNLGADRSYCFSLKTPESRRILLSADSKDVFVDGDIFNTDDFTKFIHRLERDNVAPALVTFEPVAGLQCYKECDHPICGEVAYAQLEKRLRKIFELLKSGGYIYLDRPFQFDVDDFADFLRKKSADQYALSLQMKRIAKDLKCKLEIRKEITGLYFLIRKRLNAKKR